MTIKKMSLGDFQRISPATSAWRVYPGKGEPPGLGTLSLFRVEPAARTALHNHHYAEVYCILDGEGRMQLGGTEEVVGRGDVVTIPPLTDHTLTNLSADQPLLFLSAWWVERAALQERARQALHPSAVGSPATESAHALTPASGDGASELVICALPTPNGELHLGHLAGPYLAADIYTRFQRLSGKSVVHACGTDDHQSYVALAARQPGASVTSSADACATAIQEGFRSVDIEHDSFLRPLEFPGYGEFVNRCFDSLAARGHVETKTLPGLFCETCRMHLYEAFVLGACPSCHLPTFGGACEACGAVFSEADLEGPRCASCRKRAVGSTATRLVFPLEPHRAGLIEHLRNVHAGAGLRHACARWLEKELPDVPVTHLGAFGVEAALTTVPLEGHRYHSAVEVLPRFLLAAGMMPWIPPDTGIPGSERRWVQFFGCDNAFARAMVLPALLDAMGLARHRPAASLSNAFYLYGNQKFSTARGHAVWLRDAASRFDTDALRFFIARTRPEDEPTRFSEEAFHEHTDRVLASEWHGWLEGVLTEVRRELAGFVPEPGSWHSGHVRFFDSLRATSDRIEESFSMERFSTVEGVEELDRLVQRARSFGARESQFHGLSTYASEMKTSIALELLAAKLLALCAAPVMPRFAARVFRQLGFDAPPGPLAWPSRLDFVPPRQRIRISDRPWFEARVSP